MPKFAQQGGAVWTMDLWAGLKRLIGGHHKE
jgi:hypothetical protein